MKKNNLAHKTSSKNKFPVAGTGVALFVFSFLLYSNTLTHDFALDDELVLGRNELVLSGLKSLPDLFTKAYRYGFNHENTGQYRPLSPVFFATEIEFFGFKAGMLHFFNVFYYAICVTLIFVTFYTLLALIFPADNPAPFRISVIASLLFAAHPLHTEVVANIKSRDEILALLFMISSAFFLIKLFRKEKTTVFNRYMFVSVLCFYMALLSKESAITYLAIVPLICIFFGKLSLKKTMLVSSPYFLISILYVISVFLFLDQTLGTKEISVVNNSLVQSMDFFDSLATKVYILGKYIYLLALPFPLLFDYSYDHFPVMSPVNPWIICLFLIQAGSILFGVTTLLKAIRNRKSLLLNMFPGSPTPSIPTKTAKLQSPSSLPPSSFLLTAFSILTAFSVLFYFITLSIVSNFFIIIEATAAERFLFTPSLAFCLCLGTIVHFLIYPGFSIVPRKKRKWILFIVLIPYLFFFSFKTWHRNPDWKNDFTLFKADIDYLPNSARANYCMGTAYFRNADNPSLNPAEKNQYLQKAKTHLDRVIQIFPEYKEAWINGGLVYSRLGNHANAIKYLEKAIFLDSVSPKTSYALAIVCLSAKEIDKAMSALQLTLARDSLYIEALNDLGAAYGSRGKLQEALNYFKKAYRINPGFQGVRDNLRHTYLQLGDTVSASMIGR